MPTMTRDTVLPANTETFIRETPPPPRRRRRIWAGVLLAGVAVAIGGVLLAAHFAPPPSPVARSPLATALPTAEVSATDVSAPVGSRIVQSPCLDFGSKYCLDVDTRLRPAVDLLSHTSKGPELLKTAADNRVAIRVGQVSADAIAEFSFRDHSITVGTRLVRYGPRGQAAVLAHELRHVFDWSKIGARFSSNALNCYSTEANAFQTEATVWHELRGDKPASDTLEREVDAMTEGMDHGGAGFWLSLGSDYLEECA